MCKLLCNAFYVIEFATSDFIAFEKRQKFDTLRSVPWHKTLARKKYRWLLLRHDVHNNNNDDPKWMSLNTFEVIRYEKLTFKKLL